MSTSTRPRRLKPDHCGHCGSVGGVRWELQEEEWFCMYCGWRDQYLDDPLPYVRLRDHRILEDEP